MAREKGRERVTDPGLKRADDRHEPGTVERVLMGVSVVFTIVLFSFVAWHAWTAPPGASPQADVTGTEVLESGDVRVRVALTNSGGVGLVTVVVEVDCDDPPPSVTFDNVPVSGRRIGHVLCPPGTTAPEAVVSSYVEA